MKKENILRGVIPPMVTLFKDDYSIDWEGNALLVNYLIKKGIHGILILGSIGEFVHLSIEERKKFAEFIVREVEGRVPVLVGVGHTSTDIVVNLSKHAEDIGADYLLIVTPYYLELSDEAILKHYSRIANSVNLPILLYNFPRLTGVNISIDLIDLIVSKNENIVGIKDTTSDHSHTQGIIRKIKNKKKNFSVFTGNDNYFLNNLIDGGDGLIDGTVNFIPELSLKIFELFVKKDFLNAILLQRKLNNYCEIYKLLKPSIAVIKEAIKIKTLLNISNIVREPGTQIDSIIREKLKNILHEYDFKLN